MTIKKGEKTVVEMPNWLVALAIWGIVDIFNGFSRAIGPKSQVKSDKKEG